MKKLNFINKKDHVADKSELLEAFIGNNYQKITTRHFNLSAFFFSSLYLMYRKMFGAGLVVLVGEMAVLGVAQRLTENNRTGSFVFFVVMLAIDVILCLTFNRFYLWFAKRKMMKIKAANPNATRTRLKNLYKEKGGTNGTLVIAGILAFFGVALVAALVSKAFGVPSPFTSPQGGDHANVTEKTDEKQTKTDDPNFDGNLSYDEAIDIDKVFKLTVPNEFSNNSSVYQYIFEFAENEQATYECTLTLGALMNFKNPEGLVNQMIGYYADSNPSTAQTIKLADLTWYWFTYDDFAGEEYIYTTKKDDKVYLLRYTFVDNDEAPGCGEYRTQILDSLRNA